MRDEKKLHHLLYAYNTDRFTSREDYLERYPGDEYVDVMGFDIYQRGTNEAFVKDIGNMLTMLEAMAAEKKKIPALTEFGYHNIPDSTWWTATFSQALSTHRIAWALAWRNGGGKAGVFVPYKGHTSAPDFKKMHDSDMWIFQEKVTKQKLYK
jgi:hypothetical protein